MKKALLTFLGMAFACLTASAQVKTFQYVCEDEAVTVNASDCKENSASGYKLWVRYDYKSKKACKQAAKADGVTGKPVRAEVLYEYDEPLLQYRILSKVYFDKKNQVVKRLDFYNNAPWNSIGEIDYSLKLGIYLTGFGIVAG